MLSLISKTNNALSYTIIITCAAHSIGNLFLAIKQTFSKDPTMAFWCKPTGSYGGPKTSGKHYIETVEQIIMINMGDINNQILNFARYFNNNILIIIPTIRIINLSFFKIVLFRS